MNESLYIKWTFRKVETEMRKKIFSRTYLAKDPTKFFFPFQIKIMAKELVRIDEVRMASLQPRRLQSSDLSFWAFENVFEFVMSNFVLFKTCSKICFVSS